MGSSSSKFRKHLQNGDEYAALQLYYSSTDLRKGLDPNSSYGDNFSHDTPLHYSARHAMKSLLRVFLMELGGNPNKKNARNETSLQCVCMVSNARLNYAIQQRRLECLSLILQWRGATLEDGEVERVHLSAQDEKMNTALHYAAASGLKRCVELLVNQNAPLFTENSQKQTPCDCAEKCGHNEIALFLESKMVFSNEEDVSDDVEDLLTNIDDEEGYSGLRAQDLQEAKDQLLVETSDMLHVPLFTAEALLRNHEWSREMLLEAWMQDPVTCCEKCGVVPPTSVLDDRPSTSAQKPPSGLDLDIEHDLRTPTHTVPPTNDAICDICACMIPVSEEPVSMLCEHQFCRSCWERYLTVKIQEGETHNITCPGFDCLKLVPPEIIETLVSRDMARRYLQFDIKAFVESNPSIKWCPSPGCGRAVRLPDSENPLSPSYRSNPENSQASDTSHAVDCGSGHLFCWECLGEAHEPASCENWQAWHKKIAEIRPEEMNGTEEETELAANCLWLVTNSKPCPNCKSPIQKNEGCNHMKCSKCKHDFCWVCLEGWKKHSSATGGYFRCNRYEVVKRVEDGTDCAKSEAETKNKKMQELNRFVHYYTRFKNHENSFKLEEPLLSTAKEKMMVLAKAVTDPETANLETKFVEDAVIQILKSRRVLKCSYVYGFYLDEAGYKKPIFEFMQTELEECTETLSEMVARPYLRTPRSKIIQTAHLVQRKRHEFVTAIAKGLVPPDSSPTMRKKRKKFNVEVDDDLRKALLASMHELDPSNPWVKDPSGKHTNVSALLDWPEESDESDTEISPQNSISIASLKASGQLSGADVDSDGQTNSDDINIDLSPEDIVEPELCGREGCSRLRANNPRTNERHEHCSMKCMRMDRMEKSDGNKQEPLEFFADYQMDLLRALEMSRLQFLQEMGSLRPGTGDRSPRSPLASTSRRASDRSLLDIEIDRSPRGASPIIPRSPRIGSSNTGDMELSVPSIVLCDPPPGKNRSLQTYEEPTGEDSNLDISDLDMELEQALRLSQIALTDEEQDLKLAIELSLRDSKTMPKPESPTIPAQSQSCPPSATMCSRDSSLDTPTNKSPSSESQGPFSSEYSTIVMRVPNKSIEDLAVAEGTLPQHQSVVKTELGSGAPRDIPEPVSPHRITLRPNQMYFPGRVQEPGQIRFQGPKYHFLDNVRKNQLGGQSHAKRPNNGGRLSPRLQPNPFGIIKDISVNNIVATDTDKTKDFSEKDFSQVFVKKNICDADIEAVVFEPRPCPPLVSRPQPHWHLSQPTRHWSRPLDYAYEPGEDPWLRQSDLHNTNPSASPSHHSNGASSRSSHQDPHLHSSAHSGPVEHSRPMPNPEESLDHALQNLNDLTRHLMRDDSIDSVDMVIDSKVLESMLQGAEGYGKEAESSQPMTSSQPSQPITENPVETDSQDSLDKMASNSSQNSDLPPDENVLVLENSDADDGTTDQSEQERDAVYV